MSDSKKPRVNPQGTPFATPDLTAERVNAIAEMMREGLWLRGKSGQEYADIWQISKMRVEQLAAEAWRRVCAESDNPDAMRPEISGILRQNLMRADKVMNFRAIASLAETYTKVIGARAPERHEHAVIIAQFDSLDKKGKLEWIQARIDKLTEAKAALLEEKDEIHAELVE
jgi:hypothetical protein